MTNIAEVRVARYSEAVERYGKAFVEEAFARARLSAAARSLEAAEAELAKALAFLKSTANEMGRAAVTGEGT